MAIKIISLMQCPFCDDVEGAIFLDANGIHELSDDFENFDSSQNYHKQLIMHNSPLLKDGPCPHLVWMFAEVERHRKRGNDYLYEWEVEFDWRCSRLMETDRYDPIIDLLLGFLYGSEHEEFLPPEAHNFDSFGGHWHRTGDMPQFVFEAKGRAVFAQDIPRFMDGLAIQAQRRVASWEDGRDTRRD